MPVRIADAQPEHLADVAAIYAAEVQDSPATFDLVAPGVEHWQAHVDGPYELLVAITADELVTGYAKTGRFRDKAAYASTAETSVYVHRDHRGAGVGDALYTALLARLDAGPQRTAVAGITQPNAASMRLHARHGFAIVGTFHEVGVKDGRAWDVTWLERPLR